MTPQVVSSLARSRSGKDSPPLVEELHKKDWEKENWMAAQETETETPERAKTVRLVRVNIDHKQYQGPRRREFLTNATDGHEHF